MPTIHRQDGVAFLVYTHDHEPPHVHVFKGGAEAKISLGGEDERPFLIDPKGMASTEIRRAIRIVELHQDAMLEAWRKHHA